VEMEDVLPPVFLHRYLLPDLAFIVTKPPTKTPRMQRPFWTGTKGRDLDVHGTSPGRPVPTGTY